MKLNSSQSNLKVTGAMGEESSFGIKADPKMFRILSDTMYEDKIGSIVREISCNAIDGHIKNGNVDQPFEIHLPNALEPWFAVKDYGVAMPEDDVRTILTVYGASTKDSANDMVGAFGLGAKTPMAYTNQYSVISTHAGVKMTFVVAINNDGLPVITKQHEEETTDPSGMEVVIAVEDGDFHKFRNAVVRQLQFFDVKPVLTNNLEQIEFKRFDDPETITYQTDDITIYDRNVLDGVWIIQGGVSYPLSTYNLGDLDDDIRPFVDHVQNKGSYMKFDIGQIAVTASREGISYDPATIKTIVDRMKKVATDMSTTVVKDIATADHPWDRAIIFNEQPKFMKAALRARADFETLMSDVTVNRWDTATVKDKDLVDKHFRPVYMVRHQYSRRHDYTTLYRPKRLVIGQQDSYMQRSDTHNYITPTKDMVVFVRDTNVKPVARINEFMVDNDWPTMLLIENSDTERKIADMANLRRKIADSLGINVAQVQLLSDIEPPLQTGQANASRRPRAWMYKSGEDTTDSKEWGKVYDELDDLDPTDNYVWVEMERHHIPMDSTTISDYRILTNAIKHGKTDYKLLAVNSRTAKRIKDGKIGDNLTAWTEVVSDLKKDFDKVHKQAKMLAVLKGIHHKVKADSEMKMLVEINPEIGIPEIGRLVQMLKRLPFLEKRMKADEWLLMDGTMYDDMQKGRDTVEEVLKVIEARFPILTIVRSNNYNGYTKPEREIVRDYINMVSRKGQVGA